MASNFILGMANLSNPSYTIERWHTVLVAYFILLLATTLNIYGPHLLDRISRGILLWNIVSFVVVVVVILACNDHKQPASFVFHDFQNFSGFGTAMTAIIGLLQAAFGMCCYDAPAHMTEELKEASRAAPRAIIMSVYIGAVTGFVFLVAVCFCIGDITSTAQSTTGVPLIQIFYDSTQSVVGACFLGSLITVIGIISANALLAEGSRSLYAFARDHGLPFSKVFAKVEPTRQVPVNAILLGAGVQIALNSIYFGTTTGFNTVISIATEGFCEYIGIGLHNFQNFTDTIKYRPLVCDALIGAHSRSIHWPCKSPLRPIYSWKVWPCTQYHRFCLSRFYLHYFQLSDPQSCHEG